MLPFSLSMILLSCFVASLYSCASSNAQTLEKRPSYLSPEDEPSTPVEERDGEREKGNGATGKDDGFALLQS